MCAYAVCVVCTSMYVVCSCMKLVVCYCSCPCMCNVYVLRLRASMSINVCMYAARAPLSASKGVESVTALLINNREERVTYLHGCCITRLQTPDSRTNTQILLKRYSNFSFFFFFLKMTDRSAVFGQGTKNKKIFLIKKKKKKKLAA
jgi:hypothetical protein